jgi:DNA polymerase-3 subunit beta
MQVATKALVAELAWVAKFCDSGKSIPILGNVLFEAKDGILRLTGTDLEAAGITELDGTHGKPWRITAAPKELLKYIKSIEDTEVTLSLADKALSIQASSSGASLLTIPAESFPDLPILATPSTITGLSVAIPRVLPFISSVESRFSLMGALLENAKDGARLVATDGHRMSVASIQFDGPEIHVIVPKASLSRLRTLGDTVQFGTETDFMAFACGRRKIVSRVLDGNFPDYTRVAPAEYPYHALVDASTLLKAVGRVAVFADQCSMLISLHLSEGSVVVQAEVEYTGKATEVVPVLGGDASPMKIGFNAEYLMDALGLLKGHPVAFCYKDPKSAVGIIAADGWHYMGMPCRV